MSKIAPKMVEEMQLSWDYGQGFHTDSILYMDELDIARFQHNNTYIWLRPVAEFVNSLKFVQNIVQRYFGKSYNVKVKRAYIYYDLIG